MAQNAALDTLVPLIEAAIEHDIKTVAMENAWVRSKKISKARGASAQIDNKIDALLGAIHSRLVDNIPLFNREHPIVIASQRIIDQLFAEGVRPIITLPFEEQLVKNQTIINRLKGDLKEDVATTHIGDYLAQLESLNILFRAQLKESKTKEISYDELEAARDRGNLLVRRVVAVILGTFHEETEEAVGKRQALLSPFTEQAERVRLLRKGRRNPQDIDPETGEEGSLEGTAA